MSPMWKVLEYLKLAFAIGLALLCWSSSPAYLIFLITDLEDNYINILGITSIIMGFTGLTVLLVLLVFQTQVGAGL